MLGKLTRRVGLGSLSFVQLHGAAVRAQIRPCMPLSRLTDLLTRLVGTWEMVRDADDNHRAKEFYHDEPGQDMNDWKTELAFNLAD